MTVEISENEQLIAKVLLILQKQLPPIDFLGFVATFNLGKGIDYSGFQKSTTRKRNRR